MQSSPTSTSSRGRLPTDRVAVPGTRLTGSIDGWANRLNWGASLALFLIPVALVVATIIYQRSATPPRLTVAVADRSSGAPLPGAQVAAGEQTLVTDAAGQAEVVVAAVPLAIEVRAEGYEPFAAAVDPAGATTWSVGLRRWRIAGTLVDEQSGAPIAGATVSVVGPDGAGSSVVSGADGRFSLDGVPAEGTVRVEAAEYGTVERPLGQASRLDLSLRRNVVAGIVRDTTGAPVAGARIMAADGSAATATGADGAYRLIGAAVPEVVVQASGFAGQRLAVPASGQVDVLLEAEPIKAVYANLGVLGDPVRWNELIEIANTTEINAIVVDVKQDTIYYDSQVPFFREIPGMVTPVLDLEAILAELEANGIYGIARMVVFKDPLVAEGRPDLAVKDEVTGDLWRDMNGAAWVNAFNEELWRANADLAAELARIGFDEVQYDYIRFPSDGDLRTAEFGNDYTEELRRAAISGAVAMGAEATRANGARFAIDLFPIIVLFGDDQGIGQTLQDLAPLADYVCLMIYPSHFELGNIPTADGHPNDFPAETVAYTLEMAEKLVPGSQKKMRPWLQDFTYPQAGYAEYGPAEVRAQIDAAEAAGTSGWMLWNAAGRFQAEALRRQA